MYIGPQGIVHGTFNTLLNAGRLKSRHPRTMSDLAGRLFVSAGLGGMSGAQGKAAEIAGAVVHHRRGRRFPHRDPLHAGLGQPTSTGSAPRRLARWPRRHQKAGKPMRHRLPRQHGGSAGVPAMRTTCTSTCMSRPDLLPRALRRRLLPAGPDLRRAHRDAGRGPGGVSASWSTTRCSHHYEMICKFHERGTYFFDYGNSFLKAVYDAGVKSICKNGENDLRRLCLPVLRGRHPRARCLFDYGYGPFRWCCLSRQARGPAQDRHGGRRVHQGPQPPLSGPRQLRLGARRGEEQAGRRHPVPHPLSGCHGPHEHRAEVQRNGPQRRDRPRHAGP